MNFDSKQKINRSVAFRIKIGDADHPNITYHGAVSSDLVLSPALAVCALKQHGFDEVYVAITQTSADEIRQHWSAFLGGKHEDFYHRQ